MKLGMIDMDTSHPRSWLPVIREMGHDVTCVFDGGTIYPEGYAREFAQENGIETVCESPGQMIGKVDAVIIHSSDWDLHVERARPFVEADVPVLIDKPIIGSVADAQTLLEWSAKGHVITGGSCLRFVYETQEIINRPVEERGDIHAAFCGCGVDEFNYGIHAYAMMSGIMGPDVLSVRHISTHVQHQYKLTWGDGRRGIVTVGETPGYLPFYATIVTTKKVFQYQVDNSRIYRALLEHELPILEGRAEPIDMHDLLEPELSAIGARVSRGIGGERVLLRDLHVEDEGYDGAAFAARYRKQRLPKYLESKGKKA